MRNLLQSRRNKSAPDDDDPLLDKRKHSPYTIRHNIVRKGYIRFEKQTGAARCRFFRAVEKSAAKAGLFRLFVV